MPKFSVAGGRVVADDLRTMFDSLDDAVLDAAKLTVSIMETKKDSDLSPAKGQRLLNSITAGLNKVVDGRRDMVELHRSLTAIKGESNLEVVDYGCWVASADAPERAQLPA